MKANDEKLKRIAERAEKEIESRDAMTWSFPMPYPPRDYPLTALSSDTLAYDAEKTSRHD